MVFDAASGRWSTLTSADVLTVMGWVAALQSWSKQLAGYGASSPLAQPVSRRELMARAGGEICRQRLPARRKAVGLTQEQLAERLGAERSTVLRWEGGETV
ncbi:MAG: helix-turn-helix transcriptional regulator [Pseudonocardiaceae bacterium]